MLSSAGFLVPVFKMKELQLPALRGCLAASAVSLVFAVSAQAQAQDNILIYGNSIIQGRTPLYFSDLVVQGTGVAPNLVTRISGGQDTSDYLLDQGAITGSLPAGQAWDAMIVQGGTIETTTYMGYDPAVFHSNMLGLAGALFAHSPQGLFLGHETGADHPNSGRYPSWFPDAATWLGYSQVAYEDARVAIRAAHPTNPTPATIRQGTAFASTAGYPLNLFTNDLHHHNKRGQILDALLYYQAIYGGRLCNLDVDFTQPTPLVNRLIADSITPAGWERLVGFADRSLPPSRRQFSGTDNDFQLRVSLNSPLVNLCTNSLALGGDSLDVQCVSPLGSTTNYTGIIYSQFLPTPTLPAANFPGFHLDRLQVGVLASFPDLTGAPLMFTVPSGMGGETLWLQALSLAPSGSSTYPATFSDAKRVFIH